MSAILLPGTLPGLLRRGAPVLIGREGERALVASLVEDFGARVYTADGTFLYTLSSLALDLTDPAGCDIAARWLAGRVGLRVGATAPRWSRINAPGEHGGWRIDEGMAGRNVVSALTWKGDIIVPGISTLTDPREALCLACLTLGAPQ